MIVKLREKYDFPVTLLSAESEGVDETLGLNMGADDYTTKSFTPMGLMVRVSSQLRHYHRSLDRLGPKRAENPKVHRLRDLEVNEETVEVTVDDKTVRIAPIGFKILLSLVQNPGRVFPAGETYERVWDKRTVNMDMVMVHIRDLREKVEVNPRGPKYVKVV